MTAKQLYCRQCQKVHTFDRQQAYPPFTWQQLAWEGAKDVAEVLLGVTVLLIFFIGIPWVGYLVMAR